LLFSSRVRLSPSFYVVSAFFLLYIAYTMAITIMYGRAVNVSNIANFFFIFLIVIALLWLFCSEPHQSMNFFYNVCCINLVVSTILAGIELTTGWHLPMSNMHLPENIAHNVNFPTGFFNNTNDFSIIVVLCYCFAMAYRINILKSKKHWGDYILLALCLACLCMTRCRTALMALTLFSLFIQRKKLKRYKTLLGIIGVVFLVCAALAFFLVHNHSTSVRLNLYLYSFASLLDSYCLGYGIGGDLYYYASLDNYTQFGHIINTHSYILHFLLTSGIIFFIGYIALLVYLMRKIAINHGRNEFWAMIPLYVLVLFAPSSSHLLWAQYLFFCSLVGYTCYHPMCEQKAISVCS